MDRDGSDGRLAQPPCDMSLGVFVNRVQRICHNMYSADGMGRMSQPPGNVSTSQLALDISRDVSDVQGPPWVRYDTACGAARAGSSRLRRLRMHNSRLLCMVALVVVHQWERGD